MAEIDEVIGKVRGDVGLEGMKLVEAARKLNGCVVGVPLVT